MWAALLPSILTLGGALIGANANTKAAERGYAGQVEGANITANAIREGNAQAQRTLDQVRTDAAPARSYLRTVIADPGTLTPAQMEGLEEVRRGINNQLNNSSFAGSGRTASALFRKAEGDFINTALETNRNKAFDAAKGMSGEYTNAATAIANSQANSGAAVGKVQGEAVQRGTMFGAQADIANANLTGKAIGDIGSLIANQQRESRYADRLKKIESSLGI